jgi:hypothetical protein
LALMTFNVLHNLSNVESLHLIIIKKKKKSWGHAFFNSQGQVYHKVAFDVIMMILVGYIIHHVYGE